MAERPRSEFKEMRMRLNVIEEKALGIIRGMSYFTWDSFEKYFLKNKGNSNNLSQAFDNYIKELRNELEQQSHMNVQKRV